KSDQPRPGKQISHSADAADILFPIFWGERKSKAAGELLAIGIQHFRRSIQPMPYVVAIKDKAMDPRIVEQFIEEIGHGAFAAAREPRKPNDAALMTIQS